MNNQEFLCMSVEEQAEEIRRFRAKRKPQFVPRRVIEEGPQAIAQWALRHLPKWVRGDVDLTDVEEVNRWMAAKFRQQFPFLSPETVAAMPTTMPNQRIRRRRGKTEWQDVMDIQTIAGVTVGMTTIGQGEWSKPIWVRLLEGNLWEEAEEA